MVAKKNLYPTIELQVTIAGVTVGDKDNIKLNGVDLTPKMAALLTSWYMGKVKIRLILQPIEAELFSADDIKDEPPMEKPQTAEQKKTETDKK